MNLLDTAMTAIAIGFERAGAAAMDPENATYTGGLVAVCCLIVVLMHRSAGRPGTL